MSHTRIPLAAMTTVALALALASATIAAPVARADVSPPTLVSGSPTVEADYGSSAAISSNGLYVAYVGSQVGVSGIYVKNLQTGGLRLVVAGDTGAVDGIPKLGAPSISADGQYVSFTTTETDLVHGTGSQCSSVYVRNMSMPISPAAFTLASAVDGSSASLTYEGSGDSVNCGGGGSASGGAALSGDGSEVAFTVVGASDLMTGNGVITTPPSQVAVRYLRTDTTTLVSQTMASLGSGDPQPVSPGAALTDNSATLPNPGSGSPGTDADPGDSTAAISTDGTTVAWEGLNIPAQAPASAADGPVTQANGYDEPLWRRIADGPAAPTRRVIGGDDPTACAGCVGPLNLLFDPNDITGTDAGPAFGSFIAWTGFPGGTVLVPPALPSATPRLSANGQMVAVLSTAPALGESCGRACSSLNPTTNAYVVNMAPGLSRDQAVTRITDWASESFGNLSLAGTIRDIAISPEGDRVAFVTQRTEFPYSPPALITPQLSGAAFPQMYVADLTDGTLQLATLGYDGQAANGAVTGPSFSADDGPIAFSSDATNLVYGAFSDAPGGGPEVFTITELKPPAVPGTQAIGPPPPNPTITPDWVISATAKRGRAGTVLLSVTVPSAGRLSAVVRAGVPVGRGGAKRRTPRHQTRARAVTAKRRSGRRDRVETRTLARASTGAAGAGLVELRLRAPAAYHSLLAGVHGLYATVTVRFAVVGRPPLSERLPVDLIAAPDKKHARRKPRHR